MDGTYRVEIKDRDTVLVLPNTFFSDCFKDYKASSTDERFKDMARAVVIAETIMVRKAFSPNLCIATTTKKAYAEFKAKLGESVNGLSLSSLEDAIEVNEDEGLDTLSLEQSLLAVANDMYAEDNLYPIIVVRNDAKAKWMTTYSDDFYKTHTEAKYRVDAYNMEETLIHLKSKYGEEYQRALKNLQSLSNAVLRSYIVTFIR